MNTTLDKEEESTSVVEIYGVEEKGSLFYDLIKNARTPWEPSVLKDITLQAALSALRQKEKQERILRDQVS